MNISINEKDCRKAASQMTNNTSYEVIINGTVYDVSHIYVGNHQLDAVLDSFIERKLEFAESTSSI